MKKSIILVALLAITSIINAQSRFVYVPNPGERQIGFTLGPSFGSQTFECGLNGTNDKTELTNSLGFNVGLSYNVETQWGWAIDWGQYTAFNYSATPVSGTFGGNYDLSLIIHGFEFHSASALVYRINEQILISAGIGLGISYCTPNTPKVNGTKVNLIEGDMFDNLFTQINVGLDANLGGKYLITEQFYVGANLRWTFLQFSTLSLFDEEDSDPTLKKCIGAASYDPTTNDMTVSVLNKYKPFLLEFSIGYIW